MKFNTPPPPPPPPPPPLPPNNIGYQSLRAKTLCMWLLRYWREVGGLQELRGRGGGGGVYFQEHVWSLVSLLVEKDAGTFFHRQGVTCQISADSEPLGKSLRNSHIGPACTEPIVIFLVFLFVLTTLLESNSWRKHLDSLLWYTSEDLTNQSSQSYLWTKVFPLVSWMELSGHPPLSLIPTKQFNNVVNSLTHIHWFWNDLLNLSLSRENNPLYPLVFPDIFPWIILLYYQFNPFTLKLKKYLLPTFSRETYKWGSENWSI